ncbi:ubiquinol-cytochrome c reductase iron-sulfur subunit [Thermogemmatispora carboxidivorans]|uniref:QcrA and Rieske domain-containing protein n=1 Tax=Thermogemmatispora carboxidivorans TaxID=1382306 RepID=UPI00069C2404|nr:Rieske 2Fe-2S domain-containing protein [Thermogemmatispora carboxidivorans]
MEPATHRFRVRRQDQPGSAPHPPGPAAEWRREFPYVWSEDEVVTRRDTLFFLLAGSGALCLATGTLALIGKLSEGSPAKMVPVARVGELAENRWKVFAYPDEYAQGILIHLPGKGLVAYSDVCTHLSCAVTYQPESQRLSCPCHEGLFDAATGNVLAGPPTRPLPVIELEEHQGMIYAVRMVLR